MNIKRLALGNDLPNSTVKRILQDSRGYIWLGTESGLCRYDGYRLLTVNTVQKNSKYDVSNNILCLSEDKKGRIWAGTRQGIIITDEHGRIMNLLQDHFIMERRINCICSDENNIWIATDNGLFVYDIGNNKIEAFYYQENNINSLSSNNINYIYKDNGGNIWIALWASGLCCYNKDNHCFYRLPRFGIRNNPFHIYQDKEGVFWIGTWGDGLLRMTFDKQSNTPFYKLYPHVGIEQGNVQQVIYSVVEDDLYHYLWFVTPRGVLVMKDKNGDTFEAINIKNVYEKTSNFFHTNIKDRDGNLWISASNDGIYLMNLKKNSFNYDIVKSVKDDIGYSIINGIFEKRNTLWLAITNGGVVAVDKNNTSQIVYRNKMNNCSMRQVKENPSDSSIWILGEGVHIVDVVNGKYQKRNIQSKFLNSINNLDITYEVKGVHFDTKKRVWIGLKSGIILHDDSSLDAMPICAEFSDISAIIEENPHTYWASSYSKGIIKITEHITGQFSCDFFNKRNARINSSNINTMYRDKESNIWAGSSDGGLLCLDKETNTFVSQNKTFAILENNITNIQEAKPSALWLTSSNKLIKVDLESKNSTIYSTSDNILVSSFRPGSTFLGTDSTLYFGGNEGYCSFVNNIVADENVKHKVLITDIEVLNKSIFNEDNENKVSFDNEFLTLKYDQNHIGIEFSSLNYTASGSAKYAYLLEGFDKEWIYSDGKRRFVSYNNLESGNYTFKVRSTNSNGVWDNSYTTLHIKVKPAIYLTALAYVVYAIILLSICVFALRIICNRIRLRNALAISRIEKEKAEELIQTKLRYFTNVSHELLTPLTIISCIADETMGSQNGVKTQYETMKANINRLKRLLQQILDFRKTESANMKLEVSRQDLILFVKDICKLNFAPLIKEKNIDFTINSSTGHLIACFDSDKIDKILFNLLSNAFKYTPNGGKIEINITTEQQEYGLLAKISVSDTGKGIPKELQSSIFDRFISYSANQRVEANGIGLSLAKDLIELHKGQIWVESEVAQGATFTFRFPINHDCYTQEITIDGTSENGNTEDAVNGENEYLKESEAINNLKNQQTPTLLLVEDNKDLLSSLDRYFSKKYKTLTASDGAIAIEALKNNEVDLIVSDVLMPNMTGLEFCSIIKNDINTSHIPMIMLTAKNQIEDRIECYNAGAEAYISKPFEMVILEARIQNLMNKRQKKTNEYKTNDKINIKILEYNSLDEVFLKKAIEIVEENIADFDFTYEVLMQRLNVTKSTLYRKLKSLTDLSPTEFIKNIRIKHACQMLQNNVGNISEIAYSVGFSDPKYFSTCFRAELGVTPTEYAKANTEK